MDTPTLAALTTSAGIAAATVILNALLWNTIGSDGATKARFGPIVAGLTGLVLALGAGAVLGTAGADLVQVGINGFFGGLLGAGVYDIVKSVTAKSPNA